jgi:hypothetical protein
MTRRTLSLLVAAAAVTTPLAVLAQWSGPSGSPPNNNATGPVWLQGATGGIQSGYFNVSGGTMQKATSTKGIYVSGGSVTTTQDVYVGNGKAIRVDGANGTSFNFGNFGTGATGFTLTIQGNVNVSGFGGSNGQLTATTICLTGDTCRTTWPSGGGGGGMATSSADNRYVQKTGDAMTGSLDITLSGGSPALTVTNNGAAEAINGHGVGAGANGVVGLSEQNYGVVGTVNNNSGAGVLGNAGGSATSATGVIGQGSANLGVGVFGLVNGGPGYTVSQVYNHGVGTFGAGKIGLMGRGLYGVQATGTTAGGQFYATAGAGLYSNGTTFGVSGSASAAAGVGVSGVNNTATGYGGRFTNSAASGIGLRGDATGASGTGVLGVAQNGAAGTTYGVDGEGGDIGVYGAGFSQGVYGNGKFGATGVYGVTATGTAIQGEVTDASGVGIAVYGHGTGFSNGAYFDSDNGWGLSVYGNSAAEFYGRGSYGIVAQTSNKGAAGVWGISAPTGGTGVIGTANFGGTGGSFTGGATGTGVVATGYDRGISATASAVNGIGLLTNAFGSNGIGVQGVAPLASGTGVQGNGYIGLYGNANGGGGSAKGVYADAGNGYGGYLVANTAGGFGLYSSGAAKGAYITGTTGVDARTTVSGGNAVLTSGWVAITPAFTGEDAGVSVSNPNNLSATVNLDWFADWPRIRYGGSGAGSGSGFTIEGPGDADKLTITNSGNLQISGGTATKAAGTTWAVASDIRLKDLHGDFTHGLSDITALQPIYYTFKKDNGKHIEDTTTMHVGFSAQEVEKVIPEAVSMDKDGYRQLNADPIMWAMVNSIKELKTENDSLKTKLSDLEARLEKLEASK